MILYFDNYITQASLTAGAPVWSDRVRKGRAEIYRMPSKLDISLYSLASYAALDWSAVVIKYELEDKSKTKYFESEVRKLFPKAIIMPRRSNSQADFKESVKLLRSLGDEWIFYAGNNDHPFVGASAEALGHCLARASELKKTHKFASIYLSQMLEGLGAMDARSLRHQKNWEKLGEDGWCAWALVKGGYFDAMQLVHIDLFEHWFCSKDLSESKVRLFRSDPLEHIISVPEQAVVVPKREICAHFDGYSHLVLHGYSDPDNLCPPLFIPPGFFVGKMKIAYGYGEYREGWVNVNPAAKCYSFSKAGGTDLKTAVEDLPLFWRERIAELDINPRADRQALFAAYEGELARRKAAWQGGALPHAKKAASKMAWMARYGLPRWAGRVRGWGADPDSLSRVLDERDPGAEGKVKNAAKRAVYTAIIAGHRVGLLKKKQK